MLIISLVIFQILIFTSLVFFLRRILKNNVVSATTHLEHLASDYAKKEQEIKRQLEDARRQAQELLANAQKEAEQEKKRVLKEAQEEKDKALNAVHQEADGIIQQAEKARQALIAEMEEKIEEKARHRSVELVNLVLPEHIRQEIHQHWFDDLVLSGFEGLAHLHIPEGVSEGKVITAFVLSDQQRDALNAKLKEKLGFQLSLKEELEPGIIAGLIINIGSLVFDGSMKSKIKDIL